MDSASVYASLPLDWPQKEIRFLEILETSPQLRCRLSKGSLLHNPKFCALSYVWGTSRDYHDIVVNDVTFSVTKSLADALSNIQIHWTQAFPDRNKTDMRVWADALCINQADNADKGYQVPLMKDIYSSAEITFCSLDEISSESNIPAAIDIISEIYSRLDQRHPITGLDAVSGILEDLPAHQFHRKVGGRTWGSDEHPIQAAQISIIDNFDTLQYWRRAWIVQELVLSKQVTMYYSTSSIRLEQFTRVVEWAKSLDQELPPETLPLGQNLLAIRLKVFKTIHEIKNLRRIYHCPCPEVHDMRFLWVQGASFRATNPKDHIYALCGITNLDIPPRYDENVSVAEVYIEFCIEQVKSFGKNSYFEPLHFLSHAGLSNGDPTKLGLPTWVPNFPACAEAYGESVNICFPHVREVKEWRDCIGRSEDISIRDRSLFTTSLHIDCISDVSPAIQEGTEIPFLRHVYKMLKDSFESSENPYRKDAHPFLKLASAFYHTRIPNQVWMSYELIRVARMFLWIHLSVLKARKWASKSYEDDCGDFPKNICFDLEQYKEAGDREEQPYFESFVRNISAKSLEGAEWSADSFNDLNHFWRGVRVARTIGNEFALVPPQAEAGDHIVLLRGYPMLPLIRKVEEHYAYIGFVGFAEEVVEKKLQDYNTGESKLEYVEIR
ncbi:heterokaryon incompatibility protein het-6or allele [Fusarium sporotrichioides]|uniref:Heterokaryon incompatibility protein het-6or allele n=1 Tax=Fusarium sporotrichioides TaxID=5514 RepID=A0A395RR18_FUSSP|nr:heterokaryon incompatibility protein het-6or allele [Fusarium sporotrichioides]